MKLEITEYPRTLTESRSTNLTLQMSSIALEIPTLTFLAPALSVPAFVKIGTEKILFSPQNLNNHPRVLRMQHKKSPPKFQYLAAEKLPASFTLLINHSTTKFVIKRAMLPAIIKTGESLNDCLLVKNWLQSDQNKYCKTIDPCNSAKT
ncbi:hypothetical protein ACKWTF_016885 [Chironomus riparius]